jgi:hypothetical protein
VLVKDSFEQLTTVKQMNIAVRKRTKVDFLITKVLSLKIFVGDFSGKWMRIQKVEINI